MKSLLLLLILFISSLGIGQVVFSEAFDTELPTATTGTDDSGGGVTWSTAVPFAADGADYFRVQAGRLEARDVGGPATWETGDIDISSCVGLAISFDLTEAGAMDGCLDCTAMTDPTGVGACVDWVKLEYNLDGMGFTEIAGVTCAAALTAVPGEMIQIGEILPAGSTISYTSPCIDFGTTLAVRITVNCSASTEFWRFDNISVACNDCVLPVGLDDFSASAFRKGARLDWVTSSEANNDFFEIQRSTDGHHFETIGYKDGAGNSTGYLSYSYEDPTAPVNELLYYRLKQVDFNGSLTFSRAVTFKSEAPAQVFYANNEIKVIFNNTDPNQKVVLMVYDLSGKIVDQFDLSENTTIPWTKKGFYLIEIPSLDFQEKVATF